MKIAVFFVGEVHDEGFNASALKGAERAKEAGIAQISAVSGVRFDQDEIRARLGKVLPEVDGLVFVGGQGNIATPEIAAAYPNKRFAIVQGQQTGPNLASYDVRQEDSAYLAGVLAAKLTKTGVVGHLSGHRVRPGLKGRAAFVAGALHAAPEVKVLTGFCGTQDDSTVTKVWAEAEIAAGADVIFTMLNGARRGAIEACRASRARQIGNALDWVEKDPEVFVASALARIDIGVERAIRDMVEGKSPQEIVEFGLCEGDVVSLKLAADVPDEAQEAVARAVQDIRAGHIVIPDSYDGPEFELESVPCGG